MARSDSQQGIANHVDAGHRHLCFHRSAKSVKPELNPGKLLAQIGRTDIGTLVQTAEKCVRFCSSGDRLRELVVRIENNRAAWRQRFGKHPFLLRYTLAT